MAKDTEKLIRQLSLISYLMAERRPVTATEIRRDVEGYSDMTEDAFARRFYADRAELDSLGIHLTVDKPADGFSEQENYSLAPEAFHLPAIEFTDAELAALQTALTLLDGEFAYAEPLRLALQQITWGRPSPLGSPTSAAIGLGITASAGGAELSQRLAKIDTAIYRRKRIEFEYYTMQTGETAPRKVDPYHLLFEGGQFYLVGHSHEREAIRVFRLSRIRGKVAYATKAEHDFQRPADFDPREYANRIAVAARRRRWAPPRSGCPTTSPGTSSATSAPTASCGRRRHVFRTDYAIPRLLVSLGARASASTPGCSARPSWWRRRASASTGSSSGTAASRAARPAEAPPTGGVAEVETPTAAAAARRRHDPARALRPPGHARLVLIAAGRAGERLRGRRRLRPAQDVRRRSCARTSRCSTSSTSAAAPT